MWRCNIEKLINQSGLRKDFIAQKIDVSTRQLRKYEKFELFMPMEKALLLAKVLGCKVDNFYEEDEGLIDEIKKAPLN
jgi:transcriptional regulator with XRE-family HTH domain